MTFNIIEQKIPEILLIKPQVIMPKSISEDENRMLESLRDGDNFKIS